MTLLDSSRLRHAVQLAGIVAPPRGQPFAPESRENLARWVDQREVIVEWRAKDAAGRRLGTVFVDGHDVNLEQVRAGLARRDRDSTNLLTPDERVLYEQAETAARIRHLGLWAASGPVVPAESQARQAPPD